MYPQMLAFHNWTDKEFTCEFAGESYTFEANSTYSIPEDQAKHFAKHLAMLSLNSSGNVADQVFVIQPPSPNLKALMDKALNTGVKIIQPFEKINNFYEKVETKIPEVVVVDKEESESEVEEIHTPAVKPEIKKQPKLKKLDENINSDN